MGSRATTLDVGLFFHFDLDLFFSFVNDIFHYHHGMKST